MLVKSELTRKYTGQDLDCDSAHDSRRMPVLIGATLGNMVGLGPAIHSVFGLFLIPLSKEFNWSRTEISASLTIVAFVSLFAYPLVGRYADRLGPWRIVSIGVIFFVVTLSLGSLFSGNIFQLYLFFFSISIGASFLNTTLLLKMLSETHSRDFGFASGFAGGVGNGFGSALMAMYGAFLMHHFGWRITYIGIAAFVLVLGGAALYFLRSVGKPSAALPSSIDLTTQFQSRAERSSNFWIILFSMAFMAGMSVAVFGHIVPIFAERGIGIAAASTAVATAALTSTAWQPIAGWLFGRYGPRMIMPFYLATILGLALFWYSDAWMASLFGGFCYGLGAATSFTAMPILVARYFGLHSFSRIMGFMYGGVFFAQGVGPITFDLIYDNLGSYEIALVGTAALLIVGAAGVLFLPKWNSSLPSDQSC